MTVQHIQLSPGHAAVSTYCSTLRHIGSQGRELNDDWTHPGSFTISSQTPVTVDLYHGRTDPDARDRQCPRGQLLALCRRRLAQASQRPHAERLRPDAVRRPLRAARRGDLRALDAADPASGPRQGRGLRRQPQLPDDRRTGVQLHDQPDRLTALAPPQSQL